MSEIEYKTVNHKAAGVQYRAVKGARCGQGHSGNHDLTTTFSDGSMFECCGCGTNFTREQVANPADGEIGSGGVIAD